MIVWWGDPTIIKTIYFIKCDLNPVFSHRLLLVTSAFGTEQTACVAARSALSCGRWQGLTYIVEV